MVIAHDHRVARGGYPAPTERSVGFSHYARQKLVRSTATDCNSRYGRYSLGHVSCNRSVIR